MKLQRVFGLLFFLGEELRLESLWRLVFVLVDGLEVRRRNNLLRLLLKQKVVTLVSAVFALDVLKQLVQVLFYLTFFRLNKVLRCHEALLLLILDELFYF